MSQIKGIIFDFDGTIADSTQFWCVVIEKLIRKRGTRYDEQWIKDSEHLLLKEFAVYLKERYGVKGEADELIEVINEGLEYQYFNNLTIKDGVRELLGYLKAQGIKMCIASATDKYIIDTVLKNEAIQEYFEGIITCKELGSSKRQPGVYYAARDLLKTETVSTIVIEDMLFAIRTAKDAGFFVIGVYDQFSEKNTEEIKSIADVYAVSCCDLLKDTSWLKGFIG